MEKLTDFRGAALQVDLGRGEVEPEPARQFFDAPGVDEVVIAGTTDPGVVNSGALRQHERVADQFDKAFVGALSRRGNKPFRDEEEYAQFVQSLPEYNPLIKEHAKQRATQFFPPNLKADQERRRQEEIATAQDIELTRRLGEIPAGGRAVIGGRVVEGPEVPAPEPGFQTLEEARTAAATQEGLIARPRIVEGRPAGFEVVRGTPDVDPAQQAADFARVGQPSFVTDTGEIILPTDRRHRLFTRRDELTGEITLAPGARIFGTEDVAVTALMTEDERQRIRDLTAADDLQGVQDILNAAISRRAPRRTQPSQVGTPRGQAAPPPAAAQPPPPPGGAQPAQGAAVIREKVNPQTGERIRFQLVNGQWEQING
jgi:hypothetical protein